MKNNLKRNERIIKSTQTERSERLPPGQRCTEKFPVLHYGTVPHIDFEKWRFRISGMVEKEKELSWNDILTLPKVKVISDVHCVTGWSKLDNTWEGVSTQEIKKIVRILPSARYVIVTAEQGFTTNLSLDDFFREDVLFAMKHNGETLTPEHGFPLRLVVPHLYFWKSAKWVNGIIFTDKNIPGFWESRGYHIRGDPWKEERFGF